MLRTGQSASDSWSSTVGGYTALSQLMCKLDENVRVELIAEPTA